MELRAGQPSGSKPRWCFWELAGVRNGLNADASNSVTKGCAGSFRHWTRGLKAMCGGNQGGRVSGEPSNALERFDWSLLGERAAVMSAKSTLVGTSSREGGRATA